MTALSERMNGYTMLEIPEAKVISDQLNSAITGRVIKKVVANSSPHKFAWFYGDPQHYQNVLEGKRIDFCKNVSGRVEIHTENVIIFFCDGVVIRYYRQGEKTPVKHQLTIHFDDHSSLVCSVQMCGFLYAVQEGQKEDSLYDIESLYHPKEISPLAEEFHFDYFSSIYQCVPDNLSVKAFLTTKGRFPGLGNGVLQDILYNAKIHPKRKTVSLSEKEISTLYRSVKATLLEITENGGRDTEKDIWGNRCGYKTKMSKHTLGKPCEICATPIQREAYLGGTVYYCPHCQQE